MKEEFEDQYHDLEKDHFWFKARRHCILNLLKDAPKDSLILDIGCSSGLLLEDLCNEGFDPENLFGIDISKKAINNCQKNGHANTFVMDAQAITIDKKFDIIIASDCLEHLKDDGKALKNWFDLIKPAGQAYIFVPAFMSLWSEHDEVNMHFRRYVKKDLERKLTQNHFEIQKSGYWNSLLFLPILLVRTIGNLKNSKNSNVNGDLDKISIFNNFLYQILRLENYLIQKMTFPFGVSTFCIATKNKQ